MTQVSASRAFEIHRFLVGGTMKFELVVNGLDNAFIKEFGCDCERCTRQARAANTSISLLSISRLHSTILPNPAEF